MFLRQSNILSVTLLVLVALTSGRLHAQASEAEMRGFEFPPTKGFAGEKHFGYAGDYYYPYVGDYAEFRVDTDADTYAFFRFTGIENKKVQIWPHVATISSVPPPSDRSDACAHVHLSYGVWAKYTANLHFFRVQRYRFVGGGGMSGVRNARGNCVLRVDNPVGRIDARYGWGDEFTPDVPERAVIRLNRGVTVTGVASDVIVGVSAPTHGWGTCSVPDGTFRACFEPVNLYVWTLPR